MGKLSKKTRYKCISEGLMHVAAWYHRPPGPLIPSRNLGNKFPLIAQTPNTAKFCCASDKKFARYPLSKNSAPRKSRPKFTLGHQICHQSIGRTGVSGINFGFRLLRFRDIAGFVSQMPLLYIARHLSPKI